MQVREMGNNSVVELDTKEKQIPLEMKLLQEAVLTLDSVCAILGKKLESITGQKPLRVASEDDKTRVPFAHELHASVLNINKLCAYLDDMCNCIEL